MCLGIFNTSHLGWILQGWLSVSFCFSQQKSSLDRPDDLWAIHDLLLAGYAGIFMKPDSLGSQEAPV